MKFQEFFFLILQLKRFRYKQNFFEMIRFDLIVDNDLQVYLMEGNMSPNLSSAHFQPNQLLYVRMKLHENIKLKIT